MVAKKKVDPQSFLPVKPVDLEVLMVLLDGDLHGYGLVQEIAERTGSTTTAAARLLAAAQTQLRRDALAGG